MRISFYMLCFLLLIAKGIVAQSWAVTEMANMPMAISNNAVVEGWQNGVAHVYSFGGIDSTKIYSGISLNSYRYNTQTDVWGVLPAIPDTLGKIAAGASNVNNKIYVIGGYHVGKNGSEVSSNKVHIFDPESNQFLPDASPVPVPIDDHVQAVYRDSLIYVISGWSNTGNVNDVQIFDPANNTWQVGTPVPFNGKYMHFGASGTIVGNKIYYFGGARMGFNFPISNTLRIGTINAVDPTQIIWKDTIVNAQAVGYRMAATEAFGRAHWIGGSSRTYNYDGKAYSNGSGVEPLNRNLVLLSSGKSFWSDTSSAAQYPMDLRGAARTTSGTRYIAGGMEAGQKVSKKLLKLEHMEVLGLEESKPQPIIRVFPNPSRGKLSIQFQEEQSLTEIVITNLTGQTVFSKEFKNSSLIHLEIPGEAGVYLMTISKRDGRKVVQKLVKR